LSEQPLLSIAIPTYNRAKFLRELLDTLQPQLVDQPHIELLVSDNASPDDTRQVVDHYKQQGMVISYLRNDANIGADANFIQCFEKASGKYLWVFGDDDLLTPNAVAQIVSLLHQGEKEGDYDLVYLSSIGFSGEYQIPAPALTKDRLGRFAEIVTQGDYFLEKVNALIGLISSVIINKNNYLKTQHGDLAKLKNTMILQVGWIFPVLRKKCRVLYIWERLLVYRSFNSGGWGVCQIFGINLHVVAKQYFADEPSLADSLMNGVLRYWMLDSIMAIRSGTEQNMEAENFALKLQPVFGNNWRYWLFAYPVSVLPLFVAHPLYRILRFANKLTRAAQAVIRHLLRRGQYVTPGA
jgi:abequosyltransferase